MSDKKTLLPFLLLLAVGLFLVPATLADEPEPAPAPAAVPEPDVVPRWIDETDVLFVSDHLDRAKNSFFAAHSRGFLGVHLVDLTPELCQHFGVAQDGAVMIGKVEKDSPASTSGLRVGDVITGIDSKPVLHNWDLRRQVGKHDGGEIVSLETWRDGSVQTVQVTLEEREVTRFDLGDIKKYKLKGLRVPDFPAPPDMPDFPETYTHALENVQEALKDENFLKRLQTRDTEREKELEKKLKAVEKRLQELEDRLK